ncbi:peroxisomal dehydratase [Fomitopsis serialis]|uniref:peroxisomal dehydratase n=1 Tax=Fomitopsis serialis TaxID=139415 RepID=UPI0020085F32|nr:peroxisomal dehydratase [Neoantrodia serialis]KAH9919557.1 peroxisomal dehydratase [Neoantrodia serialis]
MSGVDLAKAVGYQQEDKPVAWNQRDLLVYAVGIGAKKDDLSLANELDKAWAPFPTYPVVLGFKGTSQDVVDFRQLMAGGKSTPGLPKLNPDRVVHASQSIEILKPLPAVSGSGWKLKRRVTGVTENSEHWQWDPRSFSSDDAAETGLLVEDETVLVDGQGTPYAKLYSAAFNLGARPTGANFSKRIAGPPQAKPVPKDRKPDWVIQDQTTPEQAILYRLSGDYNMMHIDPKIGQASGFGGVILHGLATYGFAARALVSAIGGNDPKSLRFFALRFTAPVKPGDALETAVWEVGPGPDGTTEVTFITKDVTTGKVCLGAGVAYIKKLEKGKL